MLNDVLQHTIFILYDIHVGISYYFLPHFSQVFISLDIVSRPSIGVMLSAVKFDNKLGFDTIEIDDIWSQRNLAAELHAELISPQ